MNRVLPPVGLHPLGDSCWAWARAAHVACQRAGTAPWFACMFTLFLALAAFALPASAASVQREVHAGTSPSSPRWSAVVVYVVDGDTLRVRQAPGAPLVNVRIEGMDAPESCQPGGTDATFALRARLQGQTVALVGQRRDTYGRVLARVWLDQQDVGRWMVSQGHAWSYRRGRHAGPYAAEQKRAHASGQGVFARGLAPPVEPARFRKAHGRCEWPNKNAQRSSPRQAREPQH